jgi:hypothetical protein
MLWLTWRQHRFQVLALVAVLGVYAAYLVHRALPLAEPARLMQTCAGATTPGEACDQLFNYVGVDSGLTIILASVNLLPALVGVFWGAPLIARELERGTQRLAWGQSVTRQRWLTVKLAALALAALLSGAVQSVLITWATDQFTVMQTINRFEDRALFDIVGVVPPALWLFALALGVTTGLLVRRTLPAMAITLTLLAVALLGLNVLRPHYATPETRTMEQAAAARDGAAIYAPPQDWVFGTRLRRGDGRTVTDGAAQQLCPQSQPPQWDEACLSGHGIAVHQSFHPQSRFWRFQWTEAGILLAGSVALAGFALIRVSRRAD